MQQALPITPEIFATPFELAPISDRGQKTYAAFEAYHDALEYAMRKFGVSKYQLGQLMGASATHQIYSWLSLSPKSAVRPGSKYLVRLAKLHEIYDSGVALAEIDAIDWITGEAVQTASRSRDYVGHRRTPVARRRELSDNEGVD